MNDSGNAATNENGLVNESSGDLLSLSEELILDARSAAAEKSTLSVPIGQLASFGGGVASLIPQLRTVTATTTLNTQGLFRLVNGEAGDVLKQAKNGDFWGSLKTASGKSKFTRWQPAESVTSTSVSVLPVNPAVMMVAVALFSIEQKLDHIEDMQREILSFLEIEKESEIEADVQTLGQLISQYKYNWDNEVFAASGHKMVLDIQRTARKHISTFQKRVAERTSKKTGIVPQSKAQQAAQALLKEFKYYRLSIYAFSLASFLEVLLGGNYREEYILDVKRKLDSISLEYRELFTSSSEYLERMTGKSFEKGVLKGVGAASEAVGKTIGRIPIVERGPVDEFLQSRGEKLKSSAEQKEKDAIGLFASVSNPGTGLFSEKLDDLRRIFNHTSGICFDDQSIYLIAE